MIEAATGALGGLGLFLLGMAIMTDGLKSFAGDALGRSLARFTHSPLSGAATGAFSTAILQSSSATTVMAVGFAGAGLLTFAQALGIVFGANIGTTITGWLVALLGFKFDIADIVMPLIFVGASLRIFGGKRVSTAGLALAGFGLIFAGIGLLQTAMEGANEFVTPESFPSDTVTGRILLVAIGIGITIVTQSSSAGVATAITAVHAGTISLTQAGAMVIGMDVGTTFTAALATVGGTVSAKRTGIAHVVYNLMTGIGAFVMLPWFIDGWHWLAPATTEPDPGIALVSFHTLFNALGVVLVLPFTQQFAALIEKIVPIEETEITRRLDPALLSHSSIAMTAVQTTLLETVSHVFQSLSMLLTSERDHGDAMDELADAQQAVSQIQQYISEIQTTDQSHDIQSNHARAIHLVDHLMRLVRRAQMQDPLRTLHSETELRQLATDLAAILKKTPSPLKSDDPTIQSLQNELDAFWAKTDARMEPYRREMISRSMPGKADTIRTIARLDAFRWLRRVSYHASRIAVHLNPATERFAESQLPSTRIEDDPDLPLQAHGPALGHTSYSPPTST